MVECSKCGNLWSGGTYSPCCNAVSTFETIFPELTEFKPCVIQNEQGNFNSVHLTDEDSYTISQSVKLDFYVSETTGKVTGVKIPDGLIVSCGMVVHQPEGCKLNVAWSGCCSRGTKSCIATHEDTPAGSSDDEATLNPSRHEQFTLSRPFKVGDEVLWVMEGDDPWLGKVIGIDGPDSLPITVEFFGRMKFSFREDGRYTHSDPEGLRLKGQE